MIASIHRRGLRTTTAFRVRRNSSASCPAWRASSRGLLALLCVSFASGCWQYVPHEVQPESVADPQAELTTLVRSSLRPPLNFRADRDTMTYTTLFGPRTLPYARMAALEITTSRGHYFRVDVFDVTERLVARFTEPDEASARRLCDTLSALHQRAVHGLTAVQPEEEAR